MAEIAFQHGVLERLVRIATALESIASSLAVTDPPTHTKET